MNLLTACSSQCCVQIDILNQQQKQYALGKQANQVSNNFLGIILTSAVLNPIAWHWDSSSSLMHFLHSVIDKLNWKVQLTYWLFNTCSPFWRLTQQSRKPREIASISNLLILNLMLLCTDFLTPPMLHRILCADSYTK